MQLCPDHATVSRLCNAIVICLVMCRAPAVGVSVQLDEEALRWGVDIYWPEDKRFYPASVLRFNAGTGKHQVCSAVAVWEQIACYQARIRLAASVPGLCA
jgi:hypothetical protein